MGEAWFVNLDDDENDLFEVIRRNPDPKETAKAPDGTGPVDINQVGELIDLSAFDDASGGLEYWNGSAWTAIAGTLTTAPAVDGNGAAINDKFSNQFTGATFSPDDNALAVLTAGTTFERRWRFQTAAGLTMYVPSASWDFIEVNAEPT